jgi:hypothetical protein
MVTENATKPDNLTGHSPTKPDKTGRRRYLPTGQNRTHPIRNVRFCPGGLSVVRCPAVHQFRCRGATA